MKIKVCGLVYRNNLLEVEDLLPDYFGFIFYQGSQRFMGNTLAPTDLRAVYGKKTGVFVDSKFEEIIKTVKTFQLDCVQLHGSENPLICEKLKEHNLEVIKVFKVGKDFDFSSTKEFQRCSDLFLFDTKGYKQGGNGVTFDWQILENYDQNVPFFLSGGIGTENIEQIFTLSKMNIYGIDLNSRIELSPGLKDIGKLKQVIEFIKGYKIAQQ
jgi:phosphoribosylanthranilate isomerase